MTREEAREAGRKRYTPEIPCRHGHRADRYVGNNDCVECSRLRANNYAREHKEEARKRAAAWRDNNLERNRRNAREFAQRNPEANRARAKKWAADNPDRYAENMRRSYENNKEQRKQSAKIWGGNNPGRRRAYVANNRARRKLARNSVLAVLHRKRTVEIYARCPETHEVDHIVPLCGRTVSGLHVPWNLQYLTPEENRSKGNKLPPKNQRIADAKVPANDTEKAKVVA